jgi:thiamine biosynthesis lipoprotein
MPEPDTRHCVLPPAAPAFTMTRRRFLASLGVVAGAGAITPLLGRLEAERIASVEVSRPVLGTWARIVARDGDRARATRAVERAYAAIARVDSQMSIHRADSQLARVNAAAGRAAAVVDPAVLDVVERAYAAGARTGGVYDPTVLPLMRLYGFYRDDPARYPGDREIARTLEAMSWRGIASDRARGTLALTHAGAGLDLGSIGKGWAVDRAADALREAGIRSGLVDIGGNVYGIGVPDDRAAGWSVGVLHPVTKQVDRVFVLRDAAVATSGNYEQFKILSGIRVGHLFDARRGRPADGHLSASVEAASGVESDVGSTVAFLLGPSGFGAWPGVQTPHFIG